MRYELQMLKHILGDTIYTQDWNIYLYLDTYNPEVDLPTCIVAGSQTPLVVSSWSNAEPDSAFAVLGKHIMGPLSAGMVAGWFIMNGTTNVVAWYDAFQQPVSIISGEYVTLELGQITLKLAF